MTPGPDAGDLRLDAELRRIAEARSRGLGDHPSAQTLVDLHLGVLPPEEVDAIQEHLIYCRECAQIVLDLVAFSRPPDSGPAQPAADLDHEWDRLQTRLQREERRTDTRPPSRQRFSWPMAASLLVMLGLLGWNLRLREHIEEGRQPRADIAMADLAPDERDTERSTEGPDQVRVRPDQKWLLLLLNLGELREFPDYRLELAEPGGRALWAESGVPRQDDGAFLLEIPARMLEAKSYEVRLYGLRGGESVSLARYSFEVVRGDLSDRDR